MIDSILLVDDEDLFHLVFEDSCSLLDITLSLKSLNSSDEAAKLFEKWQSNSSDKPECVFVDLNIIGSSFDGIELIRKINFEYGNNVVIGIISSSNEPEEQAKAVQAGASQTCCSGSNSRILMRKARTHFGFDPRLDLGHLLLRRHLAWMNWCANRHRDHARRFGPLVARPHVAGIVGNRHHRHPRRH